MKETHREVTAFYDATAQSWADNWYENEKMMPFLERAMSSLPPNPRVIDIGCGAGYESMRLHNLGAQVVGIDLSEKSIAIAKERNPNCDFHVMNLLSINPVLGSFDGAVAIASFVHISEKELPRAFENIANVLCPGGRIFVVFSKGNGKTYGYIEEKSVVEINGIQHNRHFYWHSPEIMTAAAIAAGYEYIEDCLEGNDDMWVGHHYRYKL